jgi:hypothetical protein
MSLGVPAAGGSDNFSAKDAAPRAPPAAIATRNGVEVEVAVAVAVGVAVGVEVGVGVAVAVEVVGRIAVEGRQSVAS